MRALRSRTRRRALPLSILALAAALLLFPVGPGAARQQSQTRPRRATAAPPRTGARPHQTPRPSPQTSPAEPREVGDDEVISVNTSEVLLPVTVRDAAGRLAPSLTRDDFRVVEDGREQRLSDLALRQVPVDVALMVDASSSVASNLDDFRRAVEEFSSRLAPEDRVCLVKFDDRVELLQEWTTSRFQLRRSLGRITPGMFTLFNDALYLTAREQFRGARDRRHAVVVLSDGIDSGRGRSSAMDALRALLEAQASVYVIANTRIERARKQAELDTLTSGDDSSVRFNQLRIGDLREGLRVLDASEGNLARLAEATGGRLYTPDSFAALDAVYSEVAEELRHQYALYYTPDDRARDGRFRSVRVLMRDPSLKASTRVGYYAPRN
jgi:VWFA-related protein